ncbi:hypothetical protein LPJ72_002760 [Coemansia sp. Benny D160-2]|nr:hypothetical protein LPJ72_002760 [Coemansia sp. Benny D160-2]
MATPSSPTPLAFNHALYATLASPGDKEMFIFKWLSALDAYLETQAAKNDVKAAQDKLEAILLEVAMIPQAGVTKSSSGRMSWLGGGQQQQQNQQQQGKTLLGVVPKPTRVIRDLVSRCLARMYELGDVHRMGDALYAIQTTMQANRGTVDREARLASLVCAGVLFEALSTKAGFRLLSCFNDFVAITIKIIKTTKEPISIRIEATRTLGKLLQGGGGKTATEQQAKDVMKIVRPNLQHKSPLLVLASVNALHALVACTQFMRPGALPPFDAEAFVATTLVPLLANPVLVVRRAIARLVAVVIANNVTIGAPMQPPSIQQQRQQSQQGQQTGQMTADQARAARQSVAARTLGTADTAIRNSVDIYGVRSSSPQTPMSTATTNDANSRLSGDMPPALSKPTPPSKLAPVSVSAAASATTSPSAGNEGEWRNTLGRALTWLSAPFTRASASRELRAGIVDAYAAVIAELGSTVAVEHYGTICDHILVDLAAGTQIIAPEGADAKTATAAAAAEVAGGSGVSSDARVDAEILGLRNMCGWLLRVPLAQRLLTEQGKLVAAQWIWDRWLAGPLSPAMRALLEDDASAARGSASASARAWRAASPFAQLPQSRVAGAAAGGSGEVAVLVAIGEWRHLVEGLGEAVQALDIDKANTAGGGNGSPEITAVPLERWLAHPSDAMRVAAAAALGVLVQHDHAARASPVLASLGSRLQQLCAHCATSSSSSGTIATYIDPMRAAVGYAYGIAAVLSAGARASPGPLMHLPLDLVEWVHGISIRLLAAAYHRTDPAVVGSGTGARSADPAGANAALGLGAGNGISGGGRSVGERKRPAGKANGSTADGDNSSRMVALTNMRMNVGWILATALASLGSDFVSTRVQAQWTPLWDAALPQPDAGSAGFVGGDTPWSMRVHLLQSRIMTLTQVLAYLRSASAELSESKLQRLGAAIRFALMFADNALDAPPSSSGATFNPALPTRLLPCQTPVLSLHMMLRARIAECLDAITSSTTASHSSVIQGVVPAAVRLVETAIASPDNLCETFAARMAAAASRRLLRAATGDGARASTASAGSGSGDQEAATTCLRGFRSGPWGYEAETGTTTLLGAVYTADCSSNTTMPLVADAGARTDTEMPDFATCAMTGDEFDWVASVLPALTGNKVHRQPSPAYVKLVDDAVRLFGTMFLGLPEAAQLSQLDSLVLRLNELPFNSHRHAAVLTNILSALHAAVAHGSERARAGSGSGSGSGTEEGSGLSPRVARAVVEMARAGLIMPSPAHRFVAGEIIGLLATCTRDASTSYLPYLVDHLTNQAIRSRDRFARAGTAVALGSLYSRAGSIVAGRSLRQVVMLLHSLASDKDPIVHTWAIAALSEAALSAGFMFEPYARDTFQMVLKLFLSDSHTVPLHASALWLRGKEHSPPPAPADCVTRARVLPVRVGRDSAHASWSARQHLVRHDNHEAGAEAGSKGSNNQHSQNQQAQAAGAMLGNIVASGPDAALTHPNSTTHHGRAADEQQWDAGSGGDGDYLFVCARGDVDAHDARASLGRLVSSLIFVFGPELQVDGATREAVLTLLREMRRALSSVIGPMRMPMTANGASFSAIIDPDATWQTAAEYIFAAQKQLLFFPPPADDQSFLPLLVRQTLRPIVQSRDIVNGDGAGAIFALQRVAVQAMESILRLYGPRIVEALGNHVGAGQNYWADWSLCDVVWEALALHNTVADQIGARSDCGTTVQRALAADLRTLLRTAAGLVVGDVAQHQTPMLVEVLCAVFTKRSGALPAIDVGRQTIASSGSSEYVRGAALSAIDAAADQFLTDSVRQFNSVTKQLAVAALVSVLDAVDQQRPRTSGSGTDSDKWRLHPLTPLLADLVRVGYIAATAPAAQSPTLCALGLHLIQRLVDQFRDVEDPAVRGEGVPVLAIYQAQLSSAFMPALDPQSSSVSPMLGHAAMATATAYVVSGLVAERGAMVRILRLLAPQPAFHSLVANEMKTRRRRRQLARGRASSVGSSHNENAEEPLNSTTPQMRILSRISVLHAWSVILEHALRTRNQVLLDIIAIHVPLLSQMWLSAIRDSAAIGVRPRDALDELARITGDSTFSEVSGSADIGVGLLLGLESTYVPLVRRPLAAWYRYYLPQFLSTVSLLLLGPDSSDDNGFRAMNSSIDAASRRVLEAGHTELMLRLNGMTTEDAATVSLDANDLPGDLQAPIAASNGSTNTAEDDVDSLQSAASPVSVLLLVFFLQELHRLSAVSSMPKYLASLIAGKTGSGDDNGVEAEEANLTAEPPRHSCSNSVSSDPFVRRTLLRLVGVLDTTNSSSSSGSSGSGTDSEAERIGDLGRAGIHVFGPTMSPDSFSIVSARWFADMQAVRSLLRGLQALLLLEQKKRRDKRRSDTSGGADDAVAMTMHGLFVSPEVSRWLPVEFWSQAVSHYIGPLIRVNGASSSSSSFAAADAVAAAMQESGDSELARMAAHQLVCRDVWTGIATMSLRLAHTMLSLFSTTMEPLPDSTSSSLLPSIASGHRQTLLDQLFANGQDAGGKQLIADEGDPQSALLSVLGLSASPSSSGSLPLSSEFGAMVVGDVVGLWAASCTILRENDNGTVAASGSATRSKAVGLASACLEAMAVVVMARSLAIPQSSPRLEADGSVALPLPLLVVRLWLDLWRKSLLVYADAKSAASSVVGFIRLFPAGAIGGAGGKPEDGVTSTAVMRMASEMLARQLPLPNEPECGSETGSLLTDNLRSGWRALNVVAWVLAMQKQKQGVEEVETEEPSGVSVEVPAKLVSLFVSSYAMQLELVSKKYQQLAPSSISDGEENTGREVAALADLLNIPSTVCLATDGDNQGVLAMLPEMARRCIPPLGKLFYAVSSKSSNNSLEETAAAVVTTRVLQALGAFGACRFADAAGAQATSSRVMAAVLMVFLSMLPPTDSSADSGGGQWAIGEAVLNLATAQPGTFKDIVVRLSKTQPMAKRRLEAAIRSHQRGSAASTTAATGSGETAAAAVATAAEPGASVAAVSGQPSDRIVLKDTFGF